MRDVRAKGVKLYACVGDCVFVCLLSSIAENNSVPFAANAEFMLSSQGAGMDKGRVRGARG